MSAAKTKAQTIIEENGVGRVLIYNIAVFSKSYCPYCKATKSLLDSMGAKYYAIELDQVGM
jgi:glutaredoxin 3